MKPVTAATRPVPPKPPGRAYVSVPRRSRPSILGSPAPSRPHELPTTTHLSRFLRLFKPGHRASPPHRPPPITNKFDFVGYIPQFPSSSQQTIWSIPPAKSKGREEFNNPKKKKQASNNHQSSSSRVVCSSDQSQPWPLTLLRAPQLRRPSRRARPPGA